MCPWRSTSRGSYHLPGAHRGLFQSFSRANRNRFWRSASRARCCHVLNAEKEPEMQTIEQGPMSAAVADQVVREVRSEGVSVVPAFFSPDDCARFITILEDILEKRVA